MANSVIISDASCLIALERIHRLEILKELFSTIQTTAIVATEFGNPLPKWIAIRSFLKDAQFLKLSKELDAGEASAITLALETEEAILIIDEKKGRRKAIALHLRIIGTLQVLLLAKSKGIIPSVKTLLDELEKENFRFSQKLKNEILIGAGEN